MLNANTDNEHQEDMLRTTRQLGSITLALFLIAMPYKVTLAEDNTSAKQAYMIDFETGQVLFEKNANERMPTSSMSKTITALVAFESVKNGQYSLEDEFLVSKKAWKKGGSKMFIEVEKKIKLGDLLKGLIIQSGNDAAICIAEGLAGSEELFADKINKKAKELGMSNTHFMNASGWPDPNHYSTAKDLTTLGRTLIQDHPEHYKLYSEKEFTFNDIKQGNRNPLLYRGIGADGIKTGHTEDGGYGLIASAQRDGRRVVLVLNGMTSVQERADESARILEWGLRSYENITLFKKGDEIQKADVIFGLKSQVGMTTSQDVRLTLPKLKKDETKATISYNAPIKAPIKKGDIIGTINIKAPNGKEYTFPLHASENILEQGVLAKMVSKMRLLVSGG